MELSYQTATFESFNFHLHTETLLTIEVFWKFWNFGNFGTRLFVWTKFTDPGIDGVERNLELVLLAPKSTSRFQKGNFGQ